MAVSAIFPDNWGLAKASGKPEPIGVEDKTLVEELGFEAGEKAAYEGPMGIFSVQTW